MKQELYRQGVHLVFTIGVVLLWLVIPAWAVVSLLLLVIGIGLLLLRTKTKLGILILHILERRRDKKRFPGKGGFLLIVGVLLTAILFPGQFVPAVLVLGISDALSTLVGKAIGKKNLHKNTNKTWAGVAAFAISCAIILFVYTPWWPLLVLLLTLLESVDYGDSLLLDDNLLLPLATAALLVLL